MARMVLTTPCVVIFDEATSMLDNITAAKVTPTCARCHPSAPCPCSPTAYPPCVKPTVCGYSRTAASSHRVRMHSCWDSGACTARSTGMNLLDGVVSLPAPSSRTTT
ncbi:MAG: hypothetical protein ABWU16_04140 [Halothiobacillaceae bacterium]